MTQIQVDKLNNDMSLPLNGRIVWRDNKGWTSPLWECLCEQGFYSTRSPAGCVTARSKDGKVLAVGFGRCSMLVAVAVAMR